MKSIGRKIKELRRSKGMSQKDIADKLGVTSQAVSKWENDSSLPEMTMLPDIAALFGIQIDDLFEYSTEKRYESIGKKIEYGRAMTNGEFESEEAFLLREIEADPEKYDAISLLGDLYRYQAECMNKKSVYYAKKALALRPNQKGDINNINNGSGGKLFDWDTSNHHELIAYWYKLLKSEPENKRVYFYLLDNLIDDGRMKEAKAVLKQSYVKNPDELNDYYDVFIREKQEGFDAVKAEYEALAEKYAEDWRVLFSIANSFSFHEYYEEAIAIWQKTFDRMTRPHYTEPFEAMAQCSIRMGDRKRAAAYYRKELELLREDWGVKYGSEVEALKEKIRVNQESGASDAHIGE
jgi:DNA-binding XRE family transcriptional regulator